MSETREIKISELVDWSEPKRVNTGQGPRDLRTAPATEQFWTAWRGDKETLKAAGVSCGKNRKTGDWEACWWQPISEEEQQQIQAKREASRAKDADVAVPSPEGLEYLPYQRAGIAYSLNAGNVLIGDEMGLGKTIQAIGIWNADPTLKTALVVCPASLRLNWAKEWKKWDTRGATVGVVNGGKASDWEAAQAADVLVINYDVLSKHRARIDARTWDLLVADEAHYCKNPKTARTKALFGAKAKGKQTQAAIAARRRVFLTGTPLVNRPIELWPLVESLDPTGLGRHFMAFAKRYCAAAKNRFGWDFSGSSNRAELQDRMREAFMVRRLKEDVLTELPAKVRQVIEIPANGASDAVRREQEAFASREQILEELQIAVELAKASDNPDDYAQAIENLKQGMSAAFTEMSAARKDVAEAKVPYVAEHLETALENGPVVCMAHHKSVVAAIAERFEGRCVTLTGETPMAKRQEAVERFQAGEVDLFIGNIQAAGVGITLVRSSHVVFAELDWVPGNLSQAEDRCHRIGQNDSVLVQHLVLEGSLDAVMARKVIDKQKVIAEVLDKEGLRDEPVATPSKKRPATVKLTPDEIDKQAAKITSAQLAAIHHGLRQLAAYCDGARSEDGMGFNKLDTGIGKSLACQATITKRQAVLGKKLVNKYRRQLDAELVAMAKGE